VELTHFDSNDDINRIVSLFVLVLGDDELQSQSAVDPHIFPMLVQTVLERVNTY